jgi:hypothetical protein
MKPIRWKGWKAFSESILGAAVPLGKRLTKEELRKLGFLYAAGDLKAMGYSAE